MFEDSMFDKKFILSFFLIWCSGLLFSQTEKENEIESVVIKSVKKYKNKKENPAYAIMQEVWKRKKTNGLANYKDYQFKNYEKIEIGLNNIDSTFMQKKIFNKLEFIFDYADSANYDNKLTLPVFFNETIFKTYGKNVPEKKEKEVPAYFSDALNQNTDAKKVFENASPSFRKEYIMWITDAKTEATRNKRMEQALEWIAEGKGRNWKYEKR